MKQKLIVGVTVILLVAVGAWLATRTSPADQQTGADTEREDAGQARTDNPSQRGNTPQGVAGDGGTDDEAARSDEAVALERFTRDTQITSLSGAPVTLTHLALRTALAEHEPRFHGCIQANGGPDALRAATRAQRVAEAAAADGGVVRPRGPSRPPVLVPNPVAGGEPILAQRVGRYAHFSVRPDGTVDPASISMDPPVPEPFARCFSEHLASLRIAGAGAGAEVAMPLNGPRQRVLARETDGGVPPM